MRTFFFLLSLFFLSFSLSAQSLAEKLGYSSEDKLLIIHADDIGLSHSENVATFLAMKAGSVNSGSIMMPCPWVPEVADFVKKNPEADLGLHLTLTSEWKSMKWSPIAPKGEVLTLIDDKGFFYDDCLKFGQKADPQEAKKELRAQVEQALKMGIKPTHLDTHMGCLVFNSPEMFSAYLEVGREYKIPVMVGRFLLQAAPQAFKDKLQPKDVIIENVMTASVTDYEAGLANYYEKTLNNLDSGVSILLIHTAFNDAEMQALSVDHPNWGAEWRQQDFDFFTSTKCKELIVKNDIKLVTWREIQEVVYGE